MGINLNNHFRGPAHPGVQPPSQQAQPKPVVKPVKPVATPNAEQTKVIRSFEMAVARLDANIGALKKANLNLAMALKSGDVGAQQEATRQVVESLTKAQGDLKDITENQFPAMRNLPPAIKNQQKFVDLANHVGEVAAHLSELAIQP